MGNGLIMFQIFPVKLLRISQNEGLKFMELDIGNKTLITYIFFQTCFKDFNLLIGIPLCLGFGITGEVIGQCIQIKHGREPTFRVVILFKPVQNILLRLYVTYKTSTVLFGQAIILAGENATSIHNNLKWA